MNPNDVINHPEVTPKLSVMEHVKPSVAFDSAVFSITDIVQAIMSSKIFSNTSTEQIIMDNWQWIVGDKFSQHCRPANLENHTLTIYAENPSWLFKMMSGHKARITRNLQHHVPDITGVAFAIEPAKKSS